LGGWTLGSIATVVSGGENLLASGTGSGIYRTLNNFGDGAVNLQGLSVSQFRADVLEAPRNNPAGTFTLTRVDPALLNADGTANQKYFAPWTTAGAIGQRIFLTGAWFWSLNSSVNKDIRVN